MIKKISLLLVSVIALTIVFFYSTIEKTLYTATGFSAKNICSGYFISGFSGDAVMAEALAPLNVAFTYVKFDIDDTNNKVTTHILGGFERKAIFTDGIGCTLLAPNTDYSNHNIKKLVWPVNMANFPWPNGNADIITDNQLINKTKLDQTLLSAFKEPSETNTRKTKAIVVIHNGKLIAEKYAPEITPFTPLLSWSMAKSITNMQVGLLVKDELIDLNAAANVPLWKKKDQQNPKFKYSDITIDHLLRMSSGLEFSEVYGIDSDATFMLSVASSASDFAADKPIIYPPDSHWAYSSGTSNIVSGIIKRTIGGDFQNYYEYTQRKLFRPLDIYSAQLEVDNDGTFIGSSYNYMTARDWAKLGQLFLQDGIWKEQRILPEGWVGYSTTPTNTNLRNNYGAHYWLNQDPDESINREGNQAKRKWPSVPTDAYFMGGFQGQYVVSIPSKNLVVVRMGFTDPGADSGIEALLAGVIDSIENKHD